jgi:hypothetical protein
LTRRKKCFAEGKRKKKYEGDMSRIEGSGHA